VPQPPVTVGDSELTLILTQELNTNGKMMVRSQTHLPQSLSDAEVHRLNGFSMHAPSMGVSG
jgi:hypothetical protein